MSYCTEGRARWPILLYTVYSVYCETSIPFHTVLSVSGRPSILSREVKYRLRCGWHTRAECARGGRGMGSVCEAHLHPVALLPGKSFIAVESVVDDLEPAAQSGSRRAMMPYDCPPSHLPTRPCSTPRQRFVASAKTTH